MTFNKNSTHRSPTSTTTIALLLALLTPALSAENSKKIKVMTYNVENLFDLEHDLGKDDWAYLPLAVKRKMPEHRAACNKVTNPTWRDECLNLDWNRTALNKKIANISSVINTSFNGSGPDILVLQEVENFKVLQELQQRGLQGKGFREIILIEGPDSRGIDVAILSKLPLLATKSHTVDLPKKNPTTEAHPTRGILEATFKVGTKKLTIYANHWPSQGNPTANRVAAAQTLSAAAEVAASRGEAIMALGDFNSLLPEINGPVGAELQTQFVDAIEERLSSVPTSTKTPGTHWYRGSWSFLDRIYVGAESEKLGLRVNWISLDVHAPEFAMRVNEFKRRDGSVERTMIPHRFSAEKQTGYADHLPLMVEVSL